MAVLPQNYPTLAEVSKQFTEDGKPLPMADVLSQENEALDDVPFFEANSNNGHRIAVETALPDAVFRKLNQGILPSKGATTDVTEGVASLTSLGKVDRLLADISGNSSIYRMRKNARHMEAMNQKWMQTLFYGDSSINPEQFLGLSGRYYDIGAGAPANARNIIDAGGTGTDNYSIWGVVWGAGKTYGIYPKGTKAGLVHEDYGVELCAAPDGVGELPMYRDWFEWNGGIAVEDWESVVRIANIDRSDLSPDGSSGAKIIELMIQASEQIKVGGGHLVWYVPGYVRTIFRQQILNRVAANLTFEDFQGRRVVMFDGAPVRKVDRLLPTESRVV